jgi:hypothetical protein
MAVGPTCNLVKDYPTLSKSAYKGKSSKKQVGTASKTIY